MSSSNCCFLTCIQITQEAGKVVSYSDLLKNFPQFVVIHIVKGFGIVNKAEVDVFLEVSCLFCDPTDGGNLISGTSAFSKSSLNTWKFSVHILSKAYLENFEHYFPSVWDEYNRGVVWTFFGIALLWDWNENWPFLYLSCFSLKSTLPQLIVSLPRPPMHLSDTLIHMIYFYNRNNYEISRSDLFNYTGLEMADWIDF